MRSSSRGFDAADVAERLRSRRTLAGSIHETLAGGDRGDARLSDGARLVTPRRPTLRKSAMSSFHPCRSRAGLRAGPRVRSVVTVDAAVVETTGSQDARADVCQPCAARLRRQRSASVRWRCRTRAPGNAFVTCAFGGVFNGVPSQKTLTVGFTNTTGAAITVNCTLVDAQAGVINPEFFPEVDRGAAHGGPRSRCCSGPRSMTTAACVFTVPRGQLSAPARDQAWWLRCIRSTRKSAAEACVHCKGRCVVTGLLHAGY